MEKVLGCVKTYLSKAAAMVISGWMVRHRPEMMVGVLFVLISILAVTRRWEAWSSAANAPAYGNGFEGMLWVLYVIVVRGVCEDF